MSEHLRKRDVHIWIAFDHDFSDVRKHAPGSHAGILLIRTSHPSANLVSDILLRVLDETDGLNRVAGCLAVADETRTRIRGGRVP